MPRQEMPSEDSQPATTDLHNLLNQNLHLHDLHPIVNDDSHGTIPTTMAFVGSIQHVPQPKALSVLFDSGSDYTYVNQKALPPGVTPAKNQNAHTADTAAGLMTTKHTVLLSDITLPEFGKSLRFDSLHANVITHDIRYDIILGRDFLLAAGIDLCFSNRVMEWQQRKVPFKSRTQPYSLCIDSTSDDIDDFFLAVDPTIRKREYQHVSIDEVVAQCKHLSSDQQTKLRQCLSNKDTLFSGKLGKYPHKQVHLDLKPGSRPIHCKPYPVPHKHLDVFKSELNSLAKDGVLERIGGSEHAYPTFVVPKKSGTVRWVSDFRLLNAQLVRRSVSASLYPRCYPEAQGLQVYDENRHFHAVLHL